MKLYYVIFNRRNPYDKKAKKRTVFYCLADNAKHAKEIARSEWSALFADMPEVLHISNMYAHRSNHPDANRITVTDWNNQIHRGRYCLKTFYGIADDQSCAEF